MLAGGSVEARLLVRGVILITRRGSLTSKFILTFFACGLPLVEPFIH